MTKIKHECWIVGVTSRSASFSIIVVSNFISMPSCSTPAFQRVESRAWGSIAVSIVDDSRP